MSYGADCNGLLHDSLRVRALSHRQRYSSPIEKIVNVMFRHS